MQSTNAVTERFWDGKTKDDCSIVTGVFRNLQNDCKMRTELLHDVRAKAIGYPRTTTGRPAYDCRRW